MIRVFYFLLGVLFFATINLAIPKTSVNPSSLYFAVVSARDEKTNSRLDPSVRNLGIFEVFPKGASALLRYHALGEGGETLLVGVGRSDKEKENLTIEVGGYYHEEVVFSKVSGRLAFKNDQVQKVLFKKIPE